LTTWFLSSYKPFVDHAIGKIELAMNEFLLAVVSAQAKILPFIICVMTKCHYVDVCEGALSFVVSIGLESQMSLFYEWNL